MVIRELDAVIETTRVGTEGIAKAVIQIKSRIVMRNTVMQK